MMNLDHILLLAASEHHSIGYYLWNFPEGLSALSIAGIGWMFTRWSQKEAKKADKLKRVQQEQREEEQRRENLQNDILELEELLTSEDTLQDLVVLKRFDSRADVLETTDDLLVKTISLMYKAIRLRVVLKTIKKNDDGFEEQVKLLEHRMSAFKASIFDIAYKLRNEIWDIDEEVMNQFFEVPNAMVFFAAIDNNSKNGRASFEIDVDADELVLKIGEEEVGKDKTKVNVVFNTVKWYINHNNPTYAKLEHVFNLRDTRNSFFKDTDAGDIYYDVYGNFANVKQITEKVNNVLMSKKDIEELNLESAYQMGSTREVLKTRDGVEFQTVGSIGSGSTYMLGSFEAFIKFMILKLDAKIQLV